MTNALFSFGTLQLPRVQQSLFGREVPMTTDNLTGYVVCEVRITDPVVIAASGSDVHPGLVATDNAADAVPGRVLELNDDELAAADRYEQAAYVRAEVVLVSGRRAFVYLPRA